MCGTIPTCMSRTIVLWYRNDLRVHDHAPLVEAAKSGSRLLPVYVLDPRSWTTEVWGIPRMSARRVQFLLESLFDLKQNLERLGCTLVVRLGKAEQVIPALIAEVKADALMMHEEVTSEERVAEARVLRAIPEGVEVRYFWGSTLYDLLDLPMDVSRIPEVFGPFRRELERDARPRRPLATPRGLPPLPEGCEAGTIPSLHDLGVPSLPVDPRAQLPFYGGETAGLRRLNTWMWEQDCLKTYKQTRNGLIGDAYSSRLSPWLALGCLSPRWVQAEIERYEAARIRNEDTYWLTFELLWRDYFRFWALKHGNALFRRDGPKKRPYPWKEDRSLFDAWCAGQTGEPFVDACMRELLSTGWLSNRGRQNAASYLAKTLGIDWRMGAAWFEYHLLDYDVCSNWGNWSYVAGVGSDPRDRVFNVVIQAERYDQDGAYVSLWVPELSKLAPHVARAPYRYPVETRRAGVVLGKTYPIKQT